MALSVKSMIALSRLLVVYLSIIMPRLHAAFLPRPLAMSPLRPMVIPAVRPMCGVQRVPVFIPVPVPMAMPDQSVMMNNVRRDGDTVDNGPQYFLPPSLNRDDGGSTVVVAQSTEAPPTQMSKMTKRIVEDDDDDDDDDDDVVEDLNDKLEDIFEGFEDAAENMKEDGEDDGDRSVNLLESDVMSTFVGGDDDADDDGDLNNSLNRGFLTNGGRTMINVINPPSGVGGVGTGGIQPVITPGYLPTNLIPGVQQRGEVDQPDQEDIRRINILNTFGIVQPQARGNPNYQQQGESPVGPNIGDVSGESKTPTNFADVISDSNMFDNDLFNFDLSFGQTNADKIFNSGTIVGDRVPDTIKRIANPAMGMSDKPFFNSAKAAPSKNPLRQDFYSPIGILPNSRALPVDLPALDPVSPKASFNGKKFNDQGINNVNTLTRPFSLPQAPSFNNGNLNNLFGGRRNSMSINSNSRFDKPASSFPVTNNVFGVKRNQMSLFPNSVPDQPVPSFPVSNDPPVMNVIPSLKSFVSSGRPSQSNSPFYPGLGSGLASSVNVLGSPRLFLGRYSPKSSPDPSLGSTDASDKQNATVNQPSHVAENRTSSTSGSATTTTTSLPEAVPEPVNATVAHTSEGTTPARPEGSTEEPVLFPEEIPLTDVNDATSPFPIINDILDNMNENFLSNDKLNPLA